MSNFTALAMPCTQEQANEMKRLCEKRGIKIGNNWNKNYPLLVNNGEHVQGNVGFAYSDSIVEYNRTLIPYNPAKFLDSLFPEKWCVRIKPNTYKFIKFLEKGNFAFENRGFNGNPVTGRAYYLINNSLVCGFDIPTDYTEVTLEELVYHYEQPKEEVMKYRFKTKEEFEATCEKNKDGFYKCGTEHFVEMMHPLFGKEYQGNPENLTRVGSWYISKEMIAPVDYVYKAPKFNLTITYEQNKQLYNISCCNWKPRFAEYAKRVDIKTDTITFTESEVDEMFKVATLDQKPELERIFGNPRIAQLKARKEELEAELEGINKELNR